MKNFLRILVMGGALLVLSLAPAAARGQGGTPPVTEAGTAVGSAFAYRGALSRNNSPYSGTCQFQFLLWDAAQGGNLVGAPLAFPDVAVAGGVYDVLLDFGSGVFRQARWLETAVQCQGDAAPVTLPRQALLPMPYAMYALGVDAANVAGLSAGPGLTYSAGQFALGPGAVTNDRLAHSGLTITPGAGLTGGGLVDLGGTTTLALDTAALQARVTGACAVGRAITAIRADGTVACAAPTLLDPLLSGGVFTLAGGLGTSK